MAEAFGASTHIERSAKPPPPRRVARRRRWLLAYALLLALSHLYQAWTPDRARPGAEEQVLELRAVRGEARLDRPTWLAYRDLGPTDRPTTTETDPPPVVLIHGSPAGAMTWRHALPSIAAARRVIVMDLPGFGHSSLHEPDYSIRAHADHLLQALDALAVERAHVVGYSQGGGVAIELAGRAPERVASMTLLSSIGVQELELLGDFALNHAIYGMQLVLFRALDLLAPDFGWLDRFPLNRMYARNYFDSDQRPLRGILERWQGPTLIIHGERDRQVPVAAAREHHRIVPQSELVYLPGGHGQLFEPEGSARVAEALLAGLDRADAGALPERADAAKGRIAAAASPPPPEGMRLEAKGSMLLALMVLLALATLASEDLTCIGAGLMVARGAIPMGAALLACLVGIFAGDLALYGSGRLLGERVVRRAPLRWLIKKDDLARAESWFAHRGLSAILASRAVPGLRFPTYVAAGVLRAPLRRVAPAFALAAGLWVPLLVGLSAWLGAPMLRIVNRYHAWSLEILLGLVILVVVIGNVVIPAFSWRGRRRLLGRCRSLSRWEFWPAWAFYPPIVIYILYLGIKHRCLTLFTAANPAMPAGGFINESKDEIFRGLSHAGEHLPPHTLLAAGASFDERLATLERFMTEHGLDFPLVLKPNAGQRGNGVAIVRDTAAAQAYLRAAKVDTLAQAFAAGDEFGIFYVRRPDEPRGRVFSVTAKQPTVVVGDGETTLGDLILLHPRAVCMAARFEGSLAARLYEVPAKGERVPLVEIGTHSRGAIFTDGSAVLTPELEAAIDRISRGYAGFCFGRYDIRTDDLAAFARGHGFKIVELNGVTAEATHIYDPEHSILDAWRILAEQWRIAFEIGAANRARGHEPASLGELLKHLLSYASADAVD